MRTKRAPTTTLVRIKTKWSTTAERFQLAFAPDSHSDSFTRNSKKKKAGITRHGECSKHLVIFGQGWGTLRRQRVTSSSHGEPMLGSERVLL